MFFFFFFFFFFFSHCRVQTPYLCASCCSLDLEDIVITYCYHHMRTQYVSYLLHCDVAQVASLTGPVTVKCCHFLNLRDCSTCSYTYLYPLTHTQSFYPHYWWLFSWNVIVWYAVKYWCHGVPNSPVGRTGVPFTEALSLPRKWAW